MGRQLREMDARGLRADRADGADLARQRPAGRAQPAHASTRRRRSSPQKRLQSLQTVRPAFMDEFERLEEELSAHYATAAEPPQSRVPRSARRRRSWSPSRVLDAPSSTPRSAAPGDVDVTEHVTARPASRARPPRLPLRLKMMQRRLREEELRILRGGRSRSRSRVTPHTARELLERRPPAPPAPPTPASIPVRKGDESADRFAARRGTRAAPARRRRRPPRWAPRAGGRPGGAGGEEQRRAAAGWRRTRT